MRVGLVWKCCSNSLFRTSSDMGSLPSVRSEEHTSELQSQSNLVCRLLLEKKKTLFTEHLHASLIAYQAAPVPILHPRDRASDADHRLLADPLHHAPAAPYLGRPTLQTEQT